jgi:hypothetical protein
MNTANDLTKHPPRSPRTRIRDYVILGRTIDKCRASISGNIGEYHYDCPLDRMLFEFKGIDAVEFRRQIENGATDEEMALWVDQHGIPMTPEQITEWSNATEALNPYENPEKREWFSGECERLRLDPANTTLFELLEADDRDSFKA